MPGISGKESSERMKKVRPNLKVLFMSGYTADVIAQRGVLDGSVAFLHKPFSPVELAAKVRQVLDTSPLPSLEPLLARRVATTESIGRSCWTLLCQHFRHDQEQRIASKWLGEGRGATAKFAVRLHR